MNAKVCPYCDQDDLWLVDVEGVSGSVKMCMECDTVWVNTECIKDGRGKAFEEWMSNRGLQANWQNIKKIGKL